MNRERKRNSTHKKANQLSFDFTSAIPIEIHTPKFEIASIKKEMIWEKKLSIELVKN
ncbi:MAG: hypothetical protein ACHQLA_06125 [Ignavibacteriales bacterium]